MGVRKRKVIAFVLTECRDRFSYGKDGRKSERDTRKNGTLKNMGIENGGKWRRIVSRTNATPFSALFIPTSLLRHSRAVTTNLNAIDSIDRPTYNNAARIIAVLNNRKPCHIPRFAIKQF